MPVPLRLLASLFVDHRIPAPMTTFTIPADLGASAQPKPKSKRQLSNAEHWKAMKAKKKAAKQSAAEVKVESSPDTLASVSSNGSISKIAGQACSLLARWV